MTIRKIKQTMTNDNQNRPPRQHTDATTGLDPDNGATHFNPLPATLMVITSAISIASSLFDIGLLGIIGGVIGLILAVIVAKTEKFHAWKPGEQLYGGALVMKFSWQKTVAGAAILAIIGFILGIMLIIVG